MFCPKLEGIPVCLLPPGVYMQNLAICGQWIVRRDACLVPVFVAILRSGVRGLLSMNTARLLFLCQFEIWD